MDKQNYTISEAEAQVINAEFHTIQEKIIAKLEENHVIRRRRVIKNVSVLVQAAFLYIVKKLSFQRLSDLMSYKYNVCMSDTAWKKQLRKISAFFLEAVEEHMADCSRQSTALVQKEFLGFKNAYAIDATDIAREGNDHEVMRIHTQLALTNHGSVHTKLTDTHVSENVKHLPILAEHLYLADRAYGKAGQLAYLLEQKADFIFRIAPSLIRLYEDEKCCRRLDLLPYLTGTVFSINAYIKFEGKCYPLRVMGEKIPEEKQALAEKRVRRKAAKNRTNIQAATILYSKWMIVVSSLRMSISFAEILSAYRQRWQIELFFKRCKSLLGLKKRLFRRKIIQTCSYDFGFPFA